MSSTKVISVSMPVEQVESAERLAQEENRSMGELFGEALREYQFQKRRREIEADRPRLEAIGIKEEDVVRIIKDWRKEQRAGQDPTLR